MKPEVKHTPTPWHLEIRLEGGWGIRTDEGYICFMAEYEHADKDAAFIVRTVNSHEVLLETLKLSLLVHKDTGLLKVSENVIVEKLEKVIAQAEGRQPCMCGEPSPDRLVVHRTDGPCYIREPRP